MAFAELVSVELEIQIEMILLLFDAFSLKTNLLPCFRTPELTRRMMRFRRSLLVRRMCGSLLFCFMYAFLENKTKVMLTAPNLSV